MNLEQFSEDLKNTKLKLGIDASSEVKKETQQYILLNSKLLALILLLHLAIGLVSVDTWYTRYLHQAAVLYIVVLPTISLGLGTLLACLPYRGLAWRWKLARASALVLLILYAVVLFALISFLGTSLAWLCFSQALS